jgi:cell division protein FtsI (penicillin-binding protein 3)/stage V sporulation protein D (sporulation-specific penicillin-binding protein)
MKSIFVSPFRFYLVFASILFAFSFLGGRLYYLQVYKSDKYSQFALGARKNFISVDARRGDIVDKKGNLLASTRSVVTVGLDPHSVEDGEEWKYAELAKLLGVPLEDIEKATSRKIRTSGDQDEKITKVRWVKLKDEVDEGTYRKIQYLRVKGVYGNYKHSRIYPNRNLASHILGFVNKEGVPAMGVERLADYYLRGQDGWKESEKDGRRREMPQYRSFEVAERPGLNVELSLDRIIQGIVEKELKHVVEEFNPLSASVIVGDPKSGSIFALANVPDFDPNNFNKYELSTQRNRAVSDLYEPGSTFKIVPVCGALNEGLVHGNQIIDCSVSTYQNGSRKLRLPSDHHPLGKISVHKIVQKSSNRGAAQLGIKLGANRLYEYCQRFGFGDKTDFGMGGERKGILHHPSRWDGLTITRLPMGHSVSVTPMQIHVAMSAVANNGILMKPRFINRVFDEKGKTVVSFDPTPVRRVVSAQVARNVTNMLVDVVSDEGTARQAIIEAFQVAGKTGTTQKIIDGKYSNRHHVASFSGYFPADNPAVMITIVVDEPKMTKGRLGYGGSVAGPSFQRIGKQIISYLGLKPQDKKDVVRTELAQKFKTYQAL